MNVPEWAMIGLVGVILGVMGWGIRRLVDGQDVATKELSAMSNSLVKTCGHLDVINERAGQDRAACDERHEANIDEHHRILNALDKLRS